MRRLTRNRGCMTALFVGFTVIGLLMLADPSARVLGVVTLLMFGGGGFAWVVGEYGSGPARPAHDGSVRLPDGTTSPALILPMRGGKARAGLIAQAAFAVASVVVVLNPGVFDGGIDIQLLFAGIAVVLTIGVVTGIRGWNDRSLMVALAPSGLLVRMPGSRAFVPWAAIRGIEQREVHGQPFLAVDISDPNLVRRSGGRLLAQVERGVMGHDVSIPLVVFAIPPEDVAALVARYHRNPDERARLGRGSAGAAGAPDDRDSGSGG